MSLLSAAARLSLATSTLAAERLAFAFTGRQSRRPLATALDAASEAASAELGEMTEVLSNAGGELARSGLDVAAGLLRGERESRSRLARGLRDLSSFGRLDVAGEHSRREARAKLDVFWHVRRARRAHGAARDGRPFDLEPALENARTHDSAFRFWALEGLGHDHAMGHLEAGHEPRRLLRHPAARKLADGDIAALHAGLGLAAADFVAGGLRRGAGHLRFEAALARFEEICRQNASGETQAEVALEALGLVVSVFYAPLRDGVEAALRSRPRLRRLYWHGAGRGAYFAGSQLLPGYGSLARAAERAVATPGRRAPDPGNRRDAWAGLGYAFTMVNAEQPAVLAGGLLALEPAFDASPDLRRGFGTGVAGALAMQRLLGHGRRAACLLEATEDGMPPALWRSLLREPDRQLRREGRRHSLYGALPWGAA